jgi:hypothetical protein
MLQFLKSFFGQAKPPVEPEVPKVETPAPVAQSQCGCGRSASGLCVGLHKLTAEDWAAHPDNPVKPEPKPEVAKKPAANKAVPVKKAVPAKKPAAKKTPAAIKTAPTASTRKTKKPAQ